MSDSEAITYRPAGHVDFDNLVSIREEGESAIREAGRNVTIDLSGIESGNSAVVALLMAWFRLAENSGKSIVFATPRVEIENIVELAGLTEVLPFEAGGAAPCIDHGDTGGEPGREATQSK